MIKELETIVSEEQVNKAFAKFTKQIEDINKNIDSLLKTAEFTSTENVSKETKKLGFITEPSKKKDVYKTEEKVEKEKKVVAFDEKYKEAKKLNEKIAELKKQQEKLQKVANELDKEKEKFEKTIHKQYLAIFRKKVIEPLDDFLTGKTKKGVSKILGTIPKVFRTGPTEFTEEELNELVMLRGQRYYRVDEKKLQKFKNNVQERIDVYYRSILEANLQKITKKKEDVQEAINHNISLDEALYKFLYKIAENPESQLTEDMIKEIGNRLKSVKEDLQETLAKMKTYRNSIRYTFFWAVTLGYHGWRKNKQMRDLERLLAEAKDFDIATEKDFITAGKKLDELETKTAKSLKQATKYHKEVVTFEHIKKQSEKQLDDLLEYHKKDDELISQGIAELKKDLKELSKPVDIYDYDFPPLFLDKINKQTLKLKNLREEFKQQDENSTKAMNDIEKKFTNLAEIRFQKEIGDSFDDLTAYDPEKPDLPPKTMMLTKLPDFLVTDDEKRDWGRIQYLFTGYDFQWKRMHLPNQSIIAKLRDAKTDDEKKKTQKKYNYLKTRLDKLKETIKKRKIEEYKPDFAKTKGEVNKIHLEINETLQKLEKTYKETLESKTEDLENRRLAIVNKLQLAINKMVDYKKTRWYKFIKFITPYSYSKRIDQKIIDLIKDRGEAEKLKKEKPDIKIYSRFLQEMEKKADKELKKAKRYVQPKEQSSGKLDIEEEPSPIDRRDTLEDYLTEIQEKEKRPTPEEEPIVTEKKEVKKKIDLV